LRHGQDFGPVVAFMVGVPNAESSMRVRVVLALTGLALALVASPAHGESDHIAIVPDGTYSYNIFSALLQQQDQTTAKRDSTKAPVLWLAAAGGALGLAGYFVFSPGSTPGLGSQTPLPPPGGLVPPPQITWTPQTTPPGSPNEVPDPNGLVPGSPDLPVTTTPEPVTMTLLASGLAGLGGASLLRRRKPS
jgi:hypothetical protein